MGNVKISYVSPGGDSFTGDLDKKEVTFVGNAKAGAAELQVKPGDHTFVFFIEGTPKAKYTVKLEGAEPAEDPVSDVIANNRKAAGFFNFSVPKAKTATIAKTTTAAIRGTGLATGRPVRQTARKRGAKRAKRPSGGDQ